MILFILLKASTCHKNETLEFKSCQKSGIFTIKSVNVVEFPQSPGDKLKFSLSIEHFSRIVDPIIEVQFSRSRTPEIRYRQKLCELSMLRCPSTFAEFVYGTQFIIPKNLNSGRYKLRISFLEENQRLGCFDASISLS